MYFPEELADKHAQKLIVAFLTQLRWPAALISEALDEVLDEDAISESYVRHIHKAVRDEDEAIFIDDLARYANNQSPAIRTTSEKWKNASPRIRTFRHASWPI